MLLRLGKRKEGEGKMSIAKELEAARATIEDRDQAIAAIETEKEALANRVQELEGQAEAFDVKIAEAKQDGEKDAIAKVRERAEAYGADFALEHLDASDTECQAAYTEQLKGEKDALLAELESAKAGLDTSGSAGGSDEPTTFDAYRRKLMAEGMSARDAARMARRKFKK